MYPNLYYALKDLFGVDLPGMKLFNSFGTFVAICFGVGALVLTSELKRKAALGRFTYTERTINVGGPISLLELLINCLLGFIVGYKFIGILTIPNALDNTQAFLLSPQGNLIFGVVVAAVFGGLKLWENKKQSLTNPETRVIRIWPHDRVGDILMIAAGAGLLGAKIFNAFETWEDFVRDPISSLISFSGLTFYGGLILATIALAFYAKKYKISFIHLADSAAPALMIGYAIGRIGCQIAGDGDWGILNSAYISDSNGKIVSATFEQFQHTFSSNTGYYSMRFGNLADVHHISFPSFWGLPNWLFAYNYPHNVIGEGIPFSHCISQQFCSYLPISVFPTPFYETILCTLFFVFMFSIRKKMKTPLRMFALYLFLNGIERFFIEKIRVNSVYHIGNFQPTQAEIISTLLMIAGIILYAIAPKLNSYQTK